MTARCQSRSVSSAMKQLAIQTAFQGRNARAYRRLRNVKSLRGVLETTGRCNFEKRPYLLNAHATLISKISMQKHNYIHLPCQLSCGKKAIGHYLVPRVAVVSLAVHDAIMRTIWGDC